MGHWQQGPQRAECRAEHGLTESLLLSSEFSFFKVKLSIFKKIIHSENITLSYLEVNPSIKTITFKTKSFLEGYDNESFLFLKFLKIMFENHFNFLSGNCCF